MAYFYNFITYVKKNGGALESGSIYNAGKEKEANTRRTLHAAVNRTAKSDKANVQTSTNSIYNSQEKSNTNFDQNSDNGFGVVYDDYVRENIAPEVYDKLNEVARALGVRVRFADEVDDGNANAEQKGNLITIEKFNANPLEFLLGHEVSCHTYTHPTIARCPMPLVIEQVMKDRSRLEKACG